MATGMVLVPARDTVSNGAYESAVGTGLYSLSDEKLLKVYGLKEFLQMLIRIQMLFST